MRTRETINREHGHENTEPIKVKVVGFDMPFWSLVGFMMKVAVAAVPAAIGLTILILLMIGSLFQR